LDIIEAFSLVLWLSQEFLLSQGVRIKKDVPGCVEEEFLFLGFLQFASKPQKKTEKKRVVEICASLGFVIWCSS
jgi:hypothetical protein